jgi:hypothetical protein
VILVPFEPEHLDRLTVQRSQEWLAQNFSDAEYGKSLTAAGPCYTLTDGDHIAMCAGLVNMWEGRAQAWSLLARDAGRHMTKIVRVMKRFLEMQDIRRIEAVVDNGFEPGHRMIRLLGFAHEGLMRGYLPDGRDAVLYARIQ